MGKKNRISTKDTIRDGSVDRLVFSRFYRFNSIPSECLHQIHLSLHFTCTINDYVHLCFCSVLSQSTSSKCECPSSKSTRNSKRKWFDFNWTVGHGCVRCASLLSRTFVTLSLVLSCVCLFVAVGQNLHNPTKERLTAVVDGANWQQTAPLCRRHRSFSLR